MSEHGYTQPLDVPELLSTKLAPPRPHPALVPRGRLFERLDEGLEHRLTLLSAPAGFGKTTLVSAWIAARVERQEPLPVAWVSLDGGDNDPARFWRYVTTACQAFDAAVGESALALLRTSRRLRFEAVLTTFINELTQLEHTGILVLEDIPLTQHLAMLLTRQKHRWRARKIYSLCPDDNQEYDFAPTNGNPAIVH